MERVKGIEPSYEAWEAAVLPLNYTRSGVVPQPWAGQSRDYSAGFFSRGGSKKPAPSYQKTRRHQFAVMFAALTTLPQRSSSVCV